MSNNRVIVNISTKESLHQNTKFSLGGKGVFYDGKAVKLCFDVQFID